MHFFLNRTSLITSINENMRSVEDLRFLTSFVRLHWYKKSDDNKYGEKIKNKQKNKQIRVVEKITITPSLLRVVTCVNLPRRSKWTLRWRSRPWTRSRPGTLRSSSWKTASVSCTTCSSTWPCWSRARCVPWCNRKFMQPVKGLPWGGSS